MGTERSVSLGVGAADTVSASADLLKAAAHRAAGAIGAESVDIPCPIAEPFYQSVGPWLTINCAGRRFNDGEDGQSG